ncbi:DNA topoisomerase 2-beta [Strongyloides ratti]|uniref:DNA topoisomerase 2 n=1 Tax=Strongyloides ratti TaxID=34506 RepID=A0A090MXK7_STRRB|nr:DNA topoisomerase 2-beta [Strongyloides ratti]CEF65604.1 DNA topoisomerase 2-beta [Strongyloides ratti]
MSDYDEMDLDDAVPSTSKLTLKERNGPSKDDLKVFTNIDESRTNGKQTIEQMYQKKSQLEHILLRPDTYIGSVEYTDKGVAWVYDMDEDKLVQREISYVPGLYKIFDEILVNAADNKQRDKKMNLIKVDIDKKNNTISVFNNGKGIPVAHHKVEKMYVPELIFGTLLTSSNYNDDEKKTTGGRNGYGAKLCNIFSTEFTLETSSKEYKKKFKQTWINNMTKDKEAEISKATEDDYTKVTFKPDLKKFKMKELDDDIVGLMARRAYDIAGTTPGVRVYLNGKCIPIKSFKEYAEKYVESAIGNEEEKPKIIYEKINDRWEVALTVSEKGFQSVSFVNSIATSKGGRHVDYIADQITTNLVDTVKKKAGGAKSGVNVKPFQIKNHMWIFVNCLIENPTFDSQTKENMTLQAKSFGSKAEMTEKFYKEVLKCGVVEAVLSWVRFKQQEQADKKCSTKKSTKVKGIPKLEDANEAGTKNSSKCTLILTEGDSAKTLAVSGLGVVGRDFYGVFPLRGKMLNVRDCPMKQINDNQEIGHMIKILGLQYRLKYETEEERKTLRYGRVMIMADQDQDGSHIKGLLINWIHCNWPALMKNNFVEEFITPIVKASKGSTSISFFSLPEYMEWRNNTDNWKSYKIKYYKGLGTSTSKEAKEYFSDMDRHRIPFTYSGPECERAVEMAFSKKKIEARKTWLSNWMREKKDRRENGGIEEYLYNKDTRSVSFVEFINKELILFSNMDNERSIPCLVDGLKPGQRKVLFTCFRRADKKEVKVAQLAGAVGEMSAYHHGEQSLMMTIINLAQDYVGSNNINLLLPIGQFGTRLQGGKDSASPRYIFTQLSPVTKTIFIPEDENVLRFLFEENQKIEPEWYCPIIPMVLVNGAEGIGTAWSTKIPNYNPRDVTENIRRLIRGEQMKKMIPWYKHFEGTIMQVDEQKYISSGRVGTLDDETLEITELPIKMWTQNYKESVLEDLSNSTDKSPALIQDYREYHTDQTVKFIVKMTEQNMKKCLSQGVHDILKLQTPINTSSMVLFDAEGCLRKFESPEQICQEFFEVRKKKYIERKEFLVGMLEAQSKRLSNQARFIVCKIKGEIVMENRKKKNIVDQLIKEKFDPDPVKAWKDYCKKRELEMCGEVEIEEEEANEEDSEEAGGTSTEAGLKKRLADYDYLVNMALIKLSEEEKDRLLEEAGNKLKELETLKKKSWADLWEHDLEIFEEALKKQEEKELQDIEGSIKTAQSKLAKGGNSAKNKKNKVNVDAASFKPNPNAEIVNVEFEALKNKYEKKPKKVKSQPLPKVKGDEIANALEDNDLKVPKVKKTKEPKVTKKASENKNKKESGGESDKLDDENAMEVSPVAQKRTKRNVKKAPIIIIDSESDIEFASPPPPESSQKGSKRKSATPQKAKKSKKAKVLDSSDESDE